MSCCMLSSQKDSISGTLANTKTSIRIIRKGVKGERCTTGNTMNAQLETHLIEIDLWFAWSVSGRMFERLEAWADQYRHSTDKW